jgi:hypothetical protein
MQYVLPESSLPDLRRIAQNRAAEKRVWAYAADGATSCYL